MANINFSLSALLGKHITFTAPLDLELLSIKKSNYQNCTYQLSGVINGFYVLDDCVEILVDEEYYNLSDVQILSIQ